MHPLRRLLERPERVVAGLMSGTSLDGVDAAVVRLAGSGRGLRLETLAFVYHPYDDALRDALRDACAVGTSDVRLLSQLNVRLAHAFADAVEAALAEAGLAAGALDLVGSHGQTVHHVPDAEPCAGVPTRSTLQLGDAAVLAARLGAPVVADFRAADVALGGQGAPLVPYLDDALFASGDETRGLLNLGGIANLTVLPAGAGPEAAYAFDTGPANVLIDALAGRLFGRRYDPGGALAAAGTPDEALLGRLLAEPYFQKAPPKSTGRELFGAGYVARMVAEGPADPHDLLATATALTARSVYDAYRRFAEPKHRLDRLVASGGGVHNRELMRQLAALFAPVPVETTAAFGLDPDAKEAVLFAVLAHEWANGAPTSLPAVTGAARPALLGKLALP
ncbi:MAG TPA: anhydro-N-acetylmuramic acid kinase [Rubricoccaceae bacterium]|nr:anhydro-N-acetylmuramic acid kinase [Rubricoccaceae bacterium]